MMSARLRALLKLRRSEDGSKGATVGMATDAVIDAYFDRDACERTVNEAVRSDPASAARLDRIQGILDDLRRPASTPDLSKSILAEVGRRRPWLNGSLRQWVSAGRLAAAACFLLLLSAAFIAQRIAPDTMRLSEQPAPLSELVTASRADATSGLRNIVGAFDSVRQGEPAGGSTCSSHRGKVDWDARVVLRQPRSMMYMVQQSATGDTLHCSIVRFECADKPQPTMICTLSRRFTRDQVMFQMKTPPEEPTCVALSGVNPH